MRKKDIVDYFSCPFVEIDVYVENHFILINFFRELYNVMYILLCGGNENFSISLKIKKKKNC